ncbi:tail completion protein gp17 [Alteriqipengyuania lutimaris]|uniref:DUF3168 domain-containing protein n=1 Tax=Alteriqipengyuania lutimaris TaxID=1538146 RepID=A0A395LNB7_9SPHN|nr:DUF3168 domain-containing protein [Alteriqipengyuania lutimaris]MBB3034055.1 hypothetical protein [Alteriqipengyuania lutimaris]RDS77004.1 DUF3168 domain-containing protein [Alteriqipengyuania lutimaris]
MADMQMALRQRIVAAVGHDRVFWSLVPQATALPYVRLQTISDPRPQHLGGYTSSRSTRVQADSFSKTYAEARAASAAIIAGVAQPEIVAGIKFGRTRAQGPRDLGEDVDGIGFVHRLSTDLLTEHSLA